MEHHSTRSWQRRKVDDSNRNVQRQDNAFSRVPSNQASLENPVLYLHTSTPQLPRRNVTFPDLDVSAIPEDPENSDIRFDSSSHMNVTVIEKPVAQPTFSHRRDPHVDLYTSDEDSASTGFDSNYINDRNNNRKKNDVGSTGVMENERGGISADSDIELLFHTALDFVQASTPVWPVSDAPGSGPINRSQAGVKSTFLNKSPPLLGAAALSPSHYFRLEQAKKKALSNPTYFPQSQSPSFSQLSGTTVPIDNVRHQVQNFNIHGLGSHNGNNGTVPDSEHIATKGRKASPITNDFSDVNRQTPTQLKPLPQELRGSVDHSIVNMQKIISLIPNKDSVDSLPIPELLCVNLFPHQTYGLMWLWWREQHVPYGGILADEMGLGKTVMILSLVCRGISEGGKQANKNSRQSAERGLLLSQSTLVVCPASVMGQWETEVNKKCRGITVLIYHGTGRTKYAEAVAHYGIIITTYDTLRSEANNVAESPLFKVHWNRVVLDEGHIIRNPAANLSKAVCYLSARHRWIVTGTPVHNKPGDMFSLVKFLRLEPFDSIKTWESWIGTKLVHGNDFKRLNTIACFLMLRRTKEEVTNTNNESAGGSSLQTIPPKTVLDVYVTLKPEEKKLYDHLFTFAKQALKNYLKSQERKEQDLQEAANGFASGRSKHYRNVEGETNFMSILTFLVRLKQCAVLPLLVSKGIDKNEDEDELDDSTEFDITKHLFSLKNPVFSPDFQSAKLQKMYEDLKHIKRECKARKQPMDKVIVVSEWTSLLDIVEKQLIQQGYSTTTISGSVKIKDRAGILQAFNENPKRPQILLLSLKAGGVGLNLVGANHLYILDIHWNPQLELQAQDRIHRFGQSKPVTIHRYIARETVEEKIVELQRRKLELANAVIGSAQRKDSGALGVAEVRKLFGL